MIGILNRFRKDGIEVTEDTVMDSIAKELEEPEKYQIQLVCMFVFMCFVASLRVMNGSRLRALSGQHVLDLSTLNDTVLHKEVFLAYLNAALLEPVLAIGGMQEVVGHELVINIFTLGSICWWIWMVTDAFDYTDVCQSFKYK